MPEQPLNNMSITPWYRGFWPWFLFFIPAATVVACMVTIWIAIKTDDGLVSDNYYKEGLAISETLDRQLFAKEQGIRALARVYGTENTVEVYPEAVQDDVEQLELLLIHPTKSGFDRRIILTRQGGVFRGNLNRLTAADWHLKVQPLDADWVISGRINRPTAQQAPLVP